MVEPTGMGPEFVTGVLEQRGVAPGALVVDAGCGTGAHARALAARGYRTIGVDSSPELVEEARRRAAESGDAEPELVVGDLLDWRPPEPAAAVLCRGVLNDLVDDADRAAALPALAAMLDPRGLLVADVRDWERSAARYVRGRRTERRAYTDRGEVSMWSAVVPDPDRRELVVDERVTVAGGEHRHELRMRPWTREELAAGLEEAGFAEADLIEPRAAGAREDRIVVVARRR